MLAGVATNLAAKQKSSSEAPHHEQMHFSIEEDPKRVVALPETVLDILMTDEFVVRARACEKRMAIPDETRFFVRGLRGLFVRKSATRFCDFGERMFDGHKYRPILDRRKESTRVPRNLSVGVPRPRHFAHENPWAS
jgi:hypothetical protein